MSKRRKRSSGNPKLKKTNRRKPKRSLIQKLVAAIMAWPGWHLVAMLLLFTVVCLAGFLLLDTGFRFLFGKFLPRSYFSLPGLIAFLATSVSSFVVFWRRGWLRHLIRYPDKGRLARARQIFFGGFTLVVFNIMLVFAVGPWLIHQAIAESTRVVVTVTDTDAIGGYRECQPRVKVDLYGGSWFCTTRAFFRGVDGGDRLVLEGRESPLGLSVYSYGQLTSRAGCASGGNERACAPVPIWF